MEALFAEIHPVFQKNDHTAAELLLYPQGFQQDTPTRRPRDLHRARRRPVQARRSRASCPSCRRACTSPTATSPTGPTTSRARCRSRPRAPRPRTRTSPASSTPTPSSRSSRSSSATCRSRSTSRSRPTIPSEPDSHLDNTAEDFTVDTFAESYGDPQPVGAVVKRKLGDGRDALQGQRRRDADRADGRVPRRRALLQGAGRLLPPRARLRRRARTPATRSRCGSPPAAAQSAHFTYAAVVETDKPRADPRQRGLVGRAAQPRAARPGRSTWTTTRAALDAAGVAYDVYDVDAHGRRAPDPLGILAHYSHVVWYTGDDYVPREPDAPGGSGITRVARRHAERGARLPQRRRQAVLHRQERRPRVRRGLHLQPVPGRGEHLLPERQPELHRRPGRLPAVLPRRLPLRRRRRRGRRRRSRSRCEGTLGPVRPART